MNHRDFPALRDTIALASMLQRGRDLETALTVARANVDRLLGDLEQYPKPPAGLQYNLTAAQFDERIRIINIREKIEGELADAWRTWAGIEAAIEDICRDTRYIEYVKQSEAKSA